MRRKSRNNMASLLIGDASPRRFVRPMPFRPNQPMGFYASDECLKRPVHAAHALTRLAEHFLRRVRLGRIRIDKSLEPRIARFFYDTQEAACYALAGGRSVHRKFADYGKLREKLAPLVAEFRDLLPLLDFRFKKEVDKQPPVGIS